MNQGERKLEYLFSIKIQQWKMSLCIKTSSMNGFFCVLTDSAAYEFHMCLVYSKGIFVCDSLDVLISMATGAQHLIPRSPLGLQSFSQEHAEYHFSLFISAVHATMTGCKSKNKCAFIAACTFVKNSIGFLALHCLFY